jgi:hypothetical protein
MPGSRRETDSQAAVLHLIAADNFWRDFDPDNPERREVAVWRAQLERSSVLMTRDRP